MSPSAEVQGHSRAQRVIVPAKKSERHALEPVGNYAARIVFDDSHDSGLYAWANLRELSENKEARWQANSSLRNAGDIRLPAPYRCVSAISL